MSPPVEPLNSRTLTWRLVAAALLPALFAGWLYAPVASGGLLADELPLMGYMLAPGADGPQVDWQRVVDDFHGPWAFGNGNYYRPLVTLSLALDHCLSSEPESMQHVTSIVLFAICVFSLALLFGQLFGVRAALLGGFLFAAHPAGHEPICWPCTRADFMVLIAGAFACLWFVRYLRGLPGRNLLWTGIAIGFALLSKEVAVLLVAWFVLLDVGVRGLGGPWLPRLRPHLLLLPLWLAYFAWRALILDGAVTGIGPSPTADLSRWFGLQVMKLQACIAPVGERLPAATPYALGLLTLWVVAGGLYWREHRRWLLVGAGWVLVSLLPVHWQQVTPNMGKSRYVLTALVGVAIVYAAVLGRDASARWFRYVGWLLMLPAVTLSAMAVRTIEADYGRAWAEMASLRRQIDEAGMQATEAMPLVLLTAMPETGEIPFLPPTQAFAVARRPLARRDHAFVSLGLATQQGTGPVLLEGEVGHWRALWQQGASLVYWFGTGGEARLLTVPGPGVRVATGLLRGATGFTPDVGVASPWQIAAIEVLADAPFAAGRLRWRTSAGQVGAASMAPARRAAEGWSSRVDLEHDWQFLVFGTLAGISGFDVDLPTNSAANVTELRMHAPAKPAALLRRLRGAEVSLRQLEAHLPLASLPAEAQPGTVAAVLMNQAFAYRQPLLTGAGLQIPEPARVLFRELDGFVDKDRVYYYLECRVAGGTWRSQVDWFRRIP